MGNKLTAHHYGRLNMIDTLHHEDHAKITKSMIDL